VKKVFVFEIKVQAERYELQADDDDDDNNNNNNNNNGLRNRRRNYPSSIPGGSSSHPKSSKSGDESHLSLGDYIFLTKHDGFRGVNFEKIPKPKM
jgi:hypothetical protein